MIKLNSYGRYVFLLVFFIVGISAIIIPLLVISSQGNNIALDQSFFSVVFTLAGTFLGALGVLLVAFSYYQILKERRRQKEFAQNVQQQQEKLRSLSEQGLELEKQRTGLEKQKQTLLWQMAAAESMKDDPRLAIVTAYQGLESEIQNLVTRVYRAETLEDSDKQEFNISYDFDMLAAYISPDDARAVMQMRDVRNRIIHGEVSPEEVTEDKAREFVQRAIFLTHEISQSAQIPEE